MSGRAEIYFSYYILCDVTTFLSCHSSAHSNFLYLQERFENLHLSCPRSMCDSGSQTDTFLPTGYVTPLQKDAAVQLQQPLQNAQLQKSPGNTQRVIRKVRRFFLLLIYPLHRKVVINHLPFLRLIFMAYLYYISN